MLIELTKPQTEFFISDSKYTAAVAGFGSGKTRAAVTRLLRTKFKYPSIDVAYLAPTYGLISDIAYPLFSEALESLGERYYINRQHNIVHVQGYGQIYCRTMEHPARIVGWEVGDLVLDEFDILPTDKAEEVIRKANARARQSFPDKKKNQIYVTTTPEGYKATYNMFKKSPMEDSRLIQMSTYSNAANLPDNYIQDLIEQYPEQLIKAYLLGQFVNLTQGQVYYAFDRETQTTTRTVEKREPLHIGMDFNVGAMAAIVTVGDIEIVDEFIDYYDTPDLIAAIQDRYSDHRIYVYPDPAGTSRNTTGATMTDIKLLKKAGFIVRAKKAHPPVKERVQSVNRVLEKGILKINPKKCPRLLECLEQQVYLPNGTPDKSTGLDHPLDALGYRVIWDYLLSKPRLNYAKAA